MLFMGGVVMGLPMCGNRLCVVLFVRVCTVLFVDST